MNREDWASELRALRTERDRLQETVTRVTALADDFAVDDSYLYPGMEVAEHIRAALSGQLDTRGAREDSATPSATPPADDLESG